MEELTAAEARMNAACRVAIPAQEETPVGQRQLSPKALLDIDGFRSASDIAVAIHELQQLK
jgi:hypothetical protein